jgi:hypothetical protein
MMRTWRAITFAARTVFADCLGGVGHIPEELGVVYEDDRVVEPIPDTVAHIEGVDDDIVDAVLEVEEATAEVSAVMEVVDANDLS